jgi:tetratricopeptide (TPR) repeat protein
MRLLCCAGAVMISGCMSIQEQPSARPETLSLLNRPLLALPDDPDHAAAHAKLAAARQRSAENPEDYTARIWVGRRLGYLWRMNDAIATFSDGLKQHPDHAEFLRHRGHRLISIRRFAEAQVDLERAAELIGGTPDRIEPDGLPNARNMPLTTLGFNVWYHLGLARYLQGDFSGALDAYNQTMEHSRGYDDNLVAVTDWKYMTLRRLGRHDEALKILEPITQKMDIIENHAYHRRLLVYKGVLRADEVMDVERASALKLATLGYGIGHFYMCNGDTASARKIFERVVDGNYWPAFGFIAAEVELARLGTAGESQ